MGCTAAKMTRAALPLVWKLVAIEALALAQAADLRGRNGVMGGDYRKLYDVVRGVSPELQADRPLADELGQLTALLQSEKVQQHCLAPEHDHEPN